MPSDPHLEDEVWPPAIYQEADVPLPDAAWLAAHHAKLGQTFLLLSLLCSPILLPFALFHGGRAGRGTGRWIIAGALGLLTAWAAFLIRHL